MGNTYDYDDDDGNMAMMTMITMVMIMTMITMVMIMAMITMVMLMAIMTMMTCLGGLPINGNCGKFEEGDN